MRLPLRKQRQPPPPPPKWMISDTSDRPRRRVTISLDQGRKFGLPGGALYEIGAELTIERMQGRDRVIFPALAEARAVPFAELKQAIELLEDA